MKKINRWLNEHYFLWEEEEKEGVVRLYTGIITFVLFVILGITKLAGLDLIIQIWAGIITFAAPLIAGIKAIFTRSKWNPWYWFPIVKGGVLGGLIGMLVVWILKGLFGI